MGAWSSLAAMCAAITTVALGVASAPPVSAAPGPEPAITMYVPLVEDDYMQAFVTVASNAGTIANTTISVTAAAAGSVLYYDQWENGFETTINDPTQIAGAGRTQVWGDGNAANGNAADYCARCTGDVVPAGGVFVLNNSKLPSGVGTQAIYQPGNVPTPRNAANVFFDGRDKIASTRGMAVT